MASRAPDSSPLPEDLRINRLRAIQQARRLRLAWVIEGAMQSLTVTRDWRALWRPLYGNAFLEVAVLTFGWWLLCLLPLINAEWDPGPSYGPFGEALPLFMLLAVTPIAFVVGYWQLPMLAAFLRLRQGWACPLWTELDSEMRLLRVEARWLSGLNVVVWALVLSGILQFFGYIFEMLDSQYSPLNRIGPGGSPFDIVAGLLTLIVPLFLVILPFLLIPAYQLALCALVAEDCHPREAWRYGWRIVWADRTGYGLLGLWFGLVTLIAMTVVGPLVVLATARLLGGLLLGLEGISEILITELLLGTGLLLTAPLACATAVEIYASVGELASEGEDAPEAALPRVVTVADDPAIR